MLLATIDFVKRRFGNDAPVISYSVGPLDQIGDLGCNLLNFPLLHVGQPMFGSSLSHGMLVSSNRSLDGERVNWADISGILDISGFAYSDQWGNVPMQNLRMLTKACHLQNKKLILLPQSYGPFDNEKNRELAAEAFPLTSKIYVRDIASMKYLQNLNMGLKGNQLKLAPDITLTYSCSRQERKDYCCFTPNIRLIDQGKEKWGKDYLTIIARAIHTVLHETNLDVRILIHDKGDIRIADVLQESLKSPRIKLESEGNPKEIKRIIARSQFFVGSRFHALAGALSTGTPSIALGWSHKYLELFTDYGVGEFSFLEPSSDIKLRLKELLDSSCRAEITDTLIFAGAEIASKSQFMWDEVEKDLKA